MESTVPGEIIDPGGGLEEDNRRTGRGRRLAGNAFCHARNLAIVQPTDESTFDALSEVIFEHSNLPPILSANVLRRLV